MSGREEIGRGDLLRDAWQHFLNVLADYEWGRKDVYPLRDQYGHYAVVGTVLSPNYKEQPTVVLTARRVKHLQWSVTQQPWDVVWRYDGWLVGYFNDTGEIRVFDPAKLKGKDYRLGETTYEFLTDEGVKLQEWLEKPQLRTHQKKLD